MRLAWMLLLIPSLALAVETQALWDLFDEGRYEQALEEALPALEAAPQDVDLNLMVGRSLAATLRFEEALAPLRRAASQDSTFGWRYAWANNVLGASYFALGRLPEARIALQDALASEATENATHSARGMMASFGFHEYFENWREFETDHFVFHRSPRLATLKMEDFAGRREEAFLVIRRFFGGGPSRKIHFFTWLSSEEAEDIGLPPLGFARPEYQLVHARANQTVGHEMTHVIAWHALRPTVQTGLINEGTAVCFDQTGVDHLARARGFKRRHRVRDIDVVALWNDWSRVPTEVSYPLAGAFVRRLIDRGGKERFFELFREQSHENARGVYGEQLDAWIAEFERELNGGR